MSIKAELVNSKPEIIPQTQQIFRMWQKSLLKTACSYCLRVTRSPQKNPPNQWGSTSSWVKVTLLSTQPAPGLGTKPPQQHGESTSYLDCNTELCTADYTRLSFTGTTDKKCMLVVCLLLQATGLIGKFRISPLHHSLFTHFGIPAGYRVQPTQL